MTNASVKTLALVALLAAFIVTPAAAQGDCGTEYIVQPGDNLTRIAAVCDTTVEALRDANPGVVSLIRRGDVLAIPTGAAAGPVIAITPVTGTSGTQLTVLANGFPASSPAQLTLRAADGTALLPAQITTDADGAVNLNVTVPNVTPGTELAVVITAGDVSATSNPFFVGGTPPQVSVTGGGQGGGAAVATGGATATTNTAALGTGGATTTTVTALTGFPAIPSPVGVNAEGVVFNAVNVYMVQPPGGTGTGVVSICDSQIVPVQIGVTPTVAPLTAGIQALLDFTAADFGLANLNNPMAATNLAIDEILIVNGEAVITLTGTLTSGGTCADTILRGQMEATALQYATVDTVAIFVNGIPIQDVLQ
jgi:LysM repeat protein